jgi:hypothetical protein
MRPCPMPSPLRPRDRVRTDRESLGPPKAKGFACAMFAAVGMFPAHGTLAQSCSAPAVLSPNTSYVFDTCQGDRDLVLACGVFPLAGPATVVQLDLPYPVGEVQVQSLDIGFQPAVFLLQAACRNDAPCNAVATTGPGRAGVIDLSTIDSGNYFLVIAAEGSAGDPACGPVNVGVYVTADQGELESEGMFRSGNAPIWGP